MSRIGRFVSTSRRRLTLLGAVLTLLLGAGVARAYFTTTATGTASARAATVQDVTLTAGTPSSPLYPGGSGDVALRVDNPNSVSVHLPSLELDTSLGANGLAVDAGHSGCNLSSLSFTTQDNGGSGFEVPPGSSMLDLTNAISMGTGAADACQGATFTVYLKVGS